MIDNNEQEPPEEVKPSNYPNNFGEVLKRAREAAGLSIADVAEKLLVSTDIINAIDNSQADALPAITFTQGYIRSYARIVDLPADEIIEAYNSTVPETKKITTPQSVLLVHKNSSDALVKVITTGFIVAGLIALIMWVYQTDFTRQFIVPETESGINQHAPPPKPRLELRSDQVHDEQEQVIHIEESTNVEMPDTNPAVNLEGVSAQPPVSVEEPEAVEPEAVGPELEKTQIIGADELVLTADGDSWCEILDANGQRLFYQLLAKGDEANLKGLAPFKVFLGNAPDVRIEINQKIVSFDHLINRNSKIANLNIETDAQVIRFNNR